MAGGVLTERPRELRLVEHWRLLRVGGGTVRTLFYIAKEEDTSAVSA